MTRRAGILVIVCLAGSCAGAVGLSAPAPLDPVEEARAALRTKQFARALNLLQSPAARNSAEAQYLLGLALWNGLDGPPDAAAAQQRLRFAAEHGHAAAAQALAALLATGTAAERAEAPAWRERARAAGYLPGDDPRATAAPYADARGAGLPAELRFEIARDAVRRDEVARLRALQPRELVARRGAFGRSLLAEAAEHGAADALALLLESGAAVQNADEAGITPLMLAAGQSNPALTTRLLAAGAALEAVDRWGRTPLMYAAAANRAAQIAPLLAAGASLTRQDSLGYTATDVAATRGADAALERLQAAGGQIRRAAATASNAGIDATRTGVLYRGWPPLLVAVARDDAAEVRRRAAMGEPLSAQTPGGANALQVAIEARAAAAAAALLTLGADPRQRARDGLTARERVLRAGDPALFRLFFPATEKLGAEEAATLLRLAIERGDDLMLLALLERGADPRAAGPGGVRPVQAAAARADARLLTLLIDRGADATALDARGRSALWYAAATGARANVDLLLNLQLRPDLEDAGGDSALLAATRRGDAELLAHLLQATPASATRSREAALRLAAAQGQRPLVEVLLTARSAVDATDAYGDTALMAAARWGHEAVCSRLLAAGANPRLRNRDRATAADLAELRGHHALAEKLRS